VKQLSPLLVLFAGMVCTGTLAAAETWPPVPGQASNISVGIRYYDKRIYYVEDAPIFILVTITNNGSSTYRFKLADERAWSVDFDVRTVSNRALEPAAPLVRKRTESRQIFFREVVVEAGESFSFMEDLRDYAALRQSGAFVVQARLYPELYRSPGGPPLESNRLSLNLRPPLLPGPGGIPQEMDQETNAILVREKLPPDEVVQYILSARQKEQWEKYFLYLDLEAMIVRDGSRQRQWLAESEEGRRRMLTRYRQDLQSSVVDGDIATIPMTFEVEHTAYGAEEGTVVVLEKFRSGGYIEKKRYTYYLRRKDDVWTIIDYSVVNLGTE
jgi:hypothetical protein